MSANKNHQKTPATKNIPPKTEKVEPKIPKTVIWTGEKSPQQENRTRSPPKALRLKAIHVKTPPK